MIRAARPVVMVVQERWDDGILRVPTFGPERSSDDVSRAVDVFSRAPPDEAKAVSGCLPANTETANVR